MHPSVLQENIHWQTTHTVVCAAVERAAALDVRVNLAVVDRAGTPMAFLRMNGAPWRAISIAESKAYAAASFVLRTGHGDEVLGDNASPRLGLAQRDRLIMFGGGVPLLVGDERIGGIGVSRASEEQDEARAGLDAVANVRTRS